MNTELLGRRMRGAKRSKLVWLGLAMALAGFFEAQRGTLDPLIPEPWRPIVWTVVGLAVVVLRFLTTQPLEDKAPDQEGAP